MTRSFGHTLKFTLAMARPWLSLGPGWAALSGALSTGQAETTLVTLLQLVSLWLLVDPLLGTLWELLVEQGLGRRLGQAPFSLPATSGFSLPYAQPDSPAGHFLIRLRRYQTWWREIFWPRSGQEVVTVGLATGLALLLGLFLGSNLFWLTLLVLCLTVWAGQQAPDLSTAGGGRWATVLQFLLPWLMGWLLWKPLTPLGLILALCGSAVYLGGLRMLGGHRRADWLFFLGQLAVLLLLLAFRLLPGAALFSLFIIAQVLVKTKFPHPADFLPKVQPYLVIGWLAVGVAVGSLPG